MRIDQKDLFSKALTLEGMTTQYTSELSNIECEPAVGQKLLGIANELRSLLRCIDNLKEAKSSLLELEAYTIDDENRGKYQFVARSLFSYAVVNYASCFLKGGQEKKVPLELFKDRLAQEKCHKEIMNYRKKLIGHLDENDDLREDKVVWVFQNTSERIVPLNPELSSFRTLLQREPNENQWIIHIQNVIELLKEKESEITRSTNEILKEIVVVENEYEK
ncbi:MAG: hypothetical protein A2622_13825 [Bdellovibrionales bacterium RIFCSPHIGHO2_01_FULL_40_29]|nr:MAG: hypothetical protein A2622_13825 [Bdellovibrionales bacterium RIFCSPHIGHO2_01_FULL_40_29]OFZ35229.1 MAG: hypothetical protein A3D17_14475 [Bdellovibrionales bacterium RIFCSPHIGHO2_02_FULL_40_15]